MREQPEPLVVLIADDETLVRIFVAEALQEAGYQVFEARDGQEALTILEVRGEAVGALVTDVNMPNLDGIGLAKIVSVRWPHIGIVLTSGRSAPDASAMPPGARFLAKPYRPANLVREVEAVLEPPRGAVPIALQSIPNLQPGTMHGAGGLAQPLQEPEKE